MSRILASEFEAASGSGWKFEELRAYPTSVTKPGIDGKRNKDSGSALKYVECGA
jgi:hypothetical protein